MSYSVKTLRDRHHAILRLAAEGRKNVEIAQLLNLSSVTVSCILRSPLAKAELARLRQKLEAELSIPLAERLKARLEEGATMALEQNIAIMKSPIVDVKVKARVGMHMLDRVVFKEVEDDTKETSYRDILRSLSNVEKQLQNSTVIPVQGARVIDEEKAS